MIARCVERMEQDINCLFSYDAMRLTPIGH